MDTNTNCCAAGMAEGLGLETPQERFNRLYISSTDIAAIVGVTRVAVLHARQRGLLPAPVVVNERQIHVWERATVMPHVEAWTAMVKARRAGIGYTVAVLQSCAAHQDGDCFHKDCPQKRDNEPKRTGRHCPLDNPTGDD